ncbi:GNAT family N-acetyltransferase [uncultured Psychroserpens sp.]|uniref:GNAT family N-acetyltransferase n=1 Tax=uncultured Psychroserpens sp. TaxID=255436 RepID=UPI0026299D67|nr:GNAT family N-acetyltransferase [uncultured Psychroserpens sp.]
MKTNPFTSSVFETSWSKHFNEDKTLMSFDFLEGVRFIKDKPNGIYVNAGRNLTKGLYYSLNYDKQDYKGKTFLIYDVPSYFDVEDFNAPSHSSLRIKRVFQYQGFLMDITSFNNQDEYINSQFSSKNRREFRSNQRRLETCFDIDYAFIHEAMPKEEFNVLFEQFYALLSRRFADKQTNYHHLSSKKWNYYKELVYNMLKKKQASLLVISNAKTPIGITLNFHSEDILFEAITVFDPDYYKFSIGKTSIIKLLEWCFEHNYRISDFSKGDFDYKHKWSNLAYDFEYHILYDSKSILSVLRAQYAIAYYKLKLYLRRKKINELYRKYRFYLKGGGKEKEDRAYNNYTFEKLNSFEPSDNHELIDFKSESFRFLTQFVYTFLFANPEPLENVKVYKRIDALEFVISGSKKAQKIIFS